MGNRKINMNHWNASIDKLIKNYIDTNFSATIVLLKWKTARRGFFNKRSRFNFYSACKPLTESKNNKVYLKKFNYAFYVAWKLLFKKKSTDTPS